jgi:hypothetical protein
MSADAKPLFWANVAVAAGTLALAFVTWWNVRQTTLVVTSEDRRMQQGFAPYLTATFKTAPGEEGIPDEYDITGFIITNSGYGIARNVSIHVGAYSVPYSPGNHASAERVKMAEGAGRARWTLNATYDVISEKAAVTVYTYCEDGEYRQQSYEPTVVVAAWIRYVDMFGNEYETIYDDWHERRSRWIPPENLRL